MNDGYIDMWNSWSARRSGKPVYDEWLNEYLNLFNKDSRILDLGCGLGANTLYLKEKDFKVVASDFSKEALMNVEKNVTGISTCCFDMRKDFPFYDNSFDIVIADLSLHYFDEETTKFIMKEIRRVLDNDGILLARVARTDDFNFGAMEGKELEHHFYFEGDYTKRFFDEKDIEKFFGIIGNIEYNKVSMTRDEEEYQKEKRLFMVKAIKK